MSPVSQVFHTAVTEYWTQKRIQNERIHSIIFYVHVLKAERQNFPFQSRACKHVSARQEIRKLKNNHKGK